MNTDQIIEALEQAWDADGFLGQVRRGSYDEVGGKNFLSLLRSISIADEELVPKRLLSLLWYLPLFLEWQKERVAVVHGNVLAYQQFVTETTNVLETVLGVP